MNEKLKSLYDNLVSDGYELPDYDTFVTDMGDTTKAQRLHTTIISDRWEVPERFEDFYSDVSPKKTPIKPQSNNGATSSWEEPSRFDNLIKGGKELLRLPIDFAKSAYSTIVDATPQAAAQTLEVAKTAINPTNVDEYIRNKKPIDFQRYVRENDPEFQGFSGFIKPFEIDQFIPKYGKLFMEAQGLGEDISRMEKNLPKVVERRQQLEAYVGQQKKEAAEKLEGVIQDYRDINSVGDFGSFIGSMAGQAAAQIPLSVATRGGSSVVMELATVYDKQLDRLAQEHGISREEVIERNLDNPAKGIEYAMAAAGLDKVSAGNLIGAMRKGGGSLLKKWILNPGSESLTEATQGVLEDVGSGGTVKQAVTGEGLSTRLNELAGGFIGGSVFNFSGLQREKKIADQAINEAGNTGNASINSVIDANAALTPEEQEILKTRKAEKSLEVIKSQEEKLSKQAEKAAQEVATEQELTSPNIDKILSNAEQQPSNLTEQTEVENDPIVPFSLEDQAGQTAVKAESTDDLTSKNSATQPIETRTENQFNQVKEEVREEQSPEYKEAVAKVASLQKKLSELSIEEDSDILYKELQEAKQAARSIAPVKAVGSGKKTDIQKKIEDTTGVTKPEKTVKMTPNEAIKQQVQTFYRGMGKGVRKGQDATNDLITKVQEATKDSPLQPKQISSILTKIKKTNLSAPGSISKLNSYIDKVSQDADYADKVSKAITSQKQIRSKLSDRLSFREKETIKRFLKIKPQDVIDIQEYNTLAETIKQGVKPQNKKTPLNLNSANEAIRNLTAKVYESEFQVAPSSSRSPEQMLDAISTKRSSDNENDIISELADDLNITFEEAEQLYNAENPQDLAEGKRSKIRQKLVDKVSNVKIEQQPEFNESQTNTVKLLNGINPELLTEKQLREYLQIADRINENGDFGGAGNLSVVAKMQREFEILRYKLKDSKVLNLNAFEDYVSASLPQAVEAIYGLPNEAAMFQLYTGIKDVSAAKAYAVKEQEEFVDSVNELHKKLDKQFGSLKNGFTDESIYRQGIYTELIRYSEEVDPQEAFAQNKAAIEATIDQYENVGQTEEAKEIRKLYEPFAKASSMDDVAIIMQKIDPAGKTVAEHIIGRYKKYLPEIEEYNEVWFNKPTGKINNYAGSRKWLTLGSGNTFDYDGIEDIKDLGRHYNVAKPKQASSAKEYTGTIRENAVIDFNLHKKASDQIQDMVFRMKAIPAMLQVREFVKHPDALKLFGWKKDNASSREKANNLFDKIFNKRTGIYFTFEKDSINNGQDRSSFEKGVSAVLGVLRKGGYAITLSGLSQMPKQATVLANVAVQLGADGGLLANSASEALHNNEEFNDFMKGETVSIRGQQNALFNLGTFYSASTRLEFENKFKNFFNKTLPRWTDNRLNGWMGLKPLTTTDVSVAKTSFLAFYKKYLADNGIAYEGLAKENELRGEQVRQEARAFAKQRVDTLQVVSNPAEMSKFMKENGLFPQLAKAFFVPYGTFSTNSKQRLWSNYRALATGNLAQKKAAAKDIVGTFTEQAFYNGVHQSLKVMLALAASEAIRGIYDQPEDPEFWEKHWQSTKKEITKDMGLSALPVILGSPGEDGAVDLINEGLYALHKMENPDLTKREYEREIAPISRFKNYDSNFWDYAGPYGVFFAKAHQAYKLGEKSGNEELTEDQRNIALMAMLATVLQTFNLIPADLANPIVGQSRKLIKKPSKEQPVINDSNPTPILPRSRPIKSNRPIQLRQTLVR